MSFKFKLYFNLINFRYLKESKFNWIILLLANKMIVYFIRFNDCCFIWQMKNYLKQKVTLCHTLEASFDWTSLRK